jgi:hypothetical protein
MKQIIRNYSFNKSTGTITFSDFAAISLDRVLLITNVTANTVLYQFNEPTLGGTAAGNVLTLVRATANMNNGDRLQIIYDSAAGDPLYDTPTVAMRGLYQTTPPSLTDGQHGEVQVDAQGRLLVSTAPLASVVDSVTVQPGTVTRTTYSAAASFVPAAGATDIFVLVGSTAKIAYVTRIFVSGTQTTAGNIECVLIKRSTANSGGSFVAANMIPHDSANPTAAISVGHYTANPTVGSSLGALRRERLLVPALSTPAPHDHIHWELETAGQGIALKNASQILAVNILGATLAGGLMSVSAEWYEV